MKLSNLLLAILIVGSSHRSNCIPSIFKLFLRSNPEKTVLQAPGGNHTYVIWDLAFNKKNGKCVLAESYPMPRNWKPGDPYPFMVVLQRFCRNIGL